MENYRVIEIKQSVFADNDQDANRLRQELKENKTFLLNLMSSPGSGKTTTLKQTISRMKNKYRMAVMEADIDSDVDAATIEKTGAKVRGIELSLLQRCAAHCASGTDIEEAFMSGKTAVEQMIAGVTDKMVGFECDRTNGYTCKAKLFDLSDVANFEKKFPAEWITPEGNNVTEDFVKYAMPLIQGETKLEKVDGLPRFARLKKVFAK